MKVTNYLHFSISGEIARNPTSAYKELEEVLKDEGVKGPFTLTRTTVDEANDLHHFRIGWEHEINKGDKVVVDGYTTEVERVEGYLAHYRDEYGELKNKHIRELKKL